MPRDEMVMTGSAAWPSSGASGTRAPDGHWSQPGGWNWLDQLRFRFDLGVEVLDTDLNYTLTAPPEVGRAPDLRAALVGQRDLLQTTASTVLRAAKALSFTAGGMRNRAVPLLAGSDVPRAGVGLLLVGDAAPAADVELPQLDRRLDAAGQWLTAAIESTIGATSATPVEEPQSPERLSALADVLEAFSTLRDPRDVIDLAVEAIALWYDTDVRAYRRDLAGGFVLDAWLPGVDEAGLPRRLHSSAIWARDEIVRLESLRDLEDLGWDARTTDAAFVPVRVADSVEWIITVTGRTDGSMTAMLMFLRRFVGLLLAGLERDAEDRARHRISAGLAQSDAAFDATLRLALERGTEALRASGARLTVFDAERAPALTAAYGEVSAERILWVGAGEVAALPHALVVSIEAAPETVAVFRFERRAGRFSTADARLARCAAGAIGGWLSGTFAHAGRAAASSEPEPADFVGRLGREIERVRRTEGEGVLALVRPDAPIATGSELVHVARIVQESVRSSDVTGMVSTRAAGAVLVGAPATAAAAVYGRLRRVATAQGVRARIVALPISAASPGAESLLESALEAGRVAAPTGFERPRQSDRRVHLRFDVSGEHWASLDTGARVSVRNIGVGGVLVAARLSPGVRSLAVSRLSLHDHGPSMSVVVRHMTALTASPEADQYLIGLEFVDISPAVRADVERLMRRWHEPASG
jgi:hypothetical protein